MGGCGTCDCCMCALTEYVSNSMGITLHYGYVGKPKSVFLFIPGRGVLVYACNVIHCFI